TYRRLWSCLVWRVMHALLRWPNEASPPKHYWEEPSSSIAGAVKGPAAAELRPGELHRLMFPRGQSPPVRSAPHGAALSFLLPSCKALRRRSAAILPGDDY